MGNTLITPSVIAKEALISFENEMCMGGLVHRDFKKEFVKIGSKVSIRKPVKFVASDGNTRVNQNVSESTTDITINKRKHVSWTFSMQDLTLTVSEYNKRYIQPAAAALANIVDSDLCSLNTQFQMAVGNPGTAPALFATYAAGVQKANEQLWPRKDRHCVMNPRSHSALIDSFDANIFSTKITEDAILRGATGKVIDMTIWQDANIKTHTPGTIDWTTPVVATQPTANSITITDVAAAALTMLTGDIFTMAGAYDVNPMSGDAYRHLKQFVCTKDMVQVAGAGTIEFSPAVITSGAYKTCSAVPTIGGAIVKYGTAEADCLLAQDRNMIFHKNAMALVMVPLELPSGAAFKARETYKNLSIAVVKDFDIDEYEDIIRLDIMYGVKMIYPEMGVILMG
jgi:hypothetical protein